MTTSRRILARVVAAKLIADPAKSSSIMKATAAYLVEHKMASKAHIFVNDLAREIYDQTGHLSAEAVTALPPTDAMVKLLTRSIKNLTGAKSVDLRLSQDESLIGGFIVRTPEAVIDSSIRSKLNQLSNAA